MPQSLAKIVVHLIFSTKNRESLLATKETRESMNGYVVGILRNLESPSIIVGSVADHMHILCLLSKNLSLADLMEETKKSSSKWIKKQDLSLRTFAWQNGYGAFSVSQSAVTQVKRYIANQENHHRYVSFQEEFRGFLKKYEVPYDERYVWD